MKMAVDHGAERGIAANSQRLVSFPQRRLSMMLLLFISLLLTNSPGNAIKTKKTTGNQQDLQMTPSEELVFKLDQLSSNGKKVLRFDTKRFNQFVLTKRHRKYGLVMLLTAKDERFMCSICHQVEENFIEVAQLYHDSIRVQQDEKKQNLEKGKEQEQSKPTSTLKEQAFLPLYFVVLDVDKGHEIFLKNAVQQVPLINYFPSGPQRLKGKIDVHESRVSVSEIIHFCNEQHPGLEKIPLPLNGEPAALASLIFALFSAVVGCIISNHLDAILALPWNRNFWMLISFSVYFASVGGMIFCIIRVPTTFQYYQPGKFSFIEKDGRHQMIYEGLIVGSMYLLTALSVIFLTRATIPKQTPSSYVLLRTTLTSLYNLLSATFWLSVCLYALWTLLSWYQYKNQWYSLWMLIPSNFQSVFDGSVKFNGQTSFIITWIRRLVRIGKHWLLTYQSMPDFISKVSRVLALK